VINPANRLAVVVGDDPEACNCAPAHCGDVPGRAAWRRLPSFFQDRKDRETSAAGGPDQPPLPQLKKKG